MGCFSYICPHCGKNIRDGEHYKAFHIRHGVILEEDEGYKSPYGYHVQNWDEVVKSEFDLEDSKECDGKMIDGVFMTWSDYRRAKGYPTGCKETIPETVYDEWSRAKAPSIEAQSGTSMYHKVCFDKLSDEEKLHPFLSESDPDQGGGKCRLKYTK